jgi:hypothetical protein
MLALLLATVVATTPADIAFERLYNADFAGAQKVINEALRQEPANAFYYAVRAAAYSFGEMNRLHILETDFFLDDENLSSKEKLKPDPAVRAALYADVAQARKLASARLAVTPDDRDALFTMCMAASVITDYTGLVERRQWRSVKLESEVNVYAQKLLALHPPVVDAYLNVGSVEYIVGSLPFFVRWFVHYDNIQGQKGRGIADLKLVAATGRYYGPYAKILLAVACLRDKRTREARTWLAEYARDYPGSLIVRHEIETLDRKLAAGK